MSHPLARRLILGIAFSALGTGLTMPFLYVYLSQARGIPTQTVGFIFAWMGIVSFIAAPFGGTLIDRDWILTAAHCVSQSYIRVGIVAQLGVADIAGNEGMTVLIDRLVRHARYNPANKYDYDIALLHLRRDTRRRDPARIRVAKLAALPTTDVNGPIGATGWGVTQGIGGLPVAFLRKFDLKLWDQAQCAAEPDYRPIRAENGALISRIHARVFCAGAPGIKTCPGDSGGPVAYAPRGKPPIVVGIISWAKKGCGDKNDNRPGVYTRISAYSDWIARAKKSTGPTAE